MRKGDGESCNADLRPGAGGFHCGDLWRPEYKQSTLERKEMPEQKHEPFKGIQKSAESKFEHNIVLSNTYPE